MITFKKLKVAFSLIFIVCISVIGYFYISVMLPIEPPEVTIMIGDEYLDYIIGKNQWHGTKYDREDTFQTIMKNTSASELPYIKVGSTATIQFKKHPPVKVTISDILITEDGNQIYTNKETVNIPVKLKNGKTSFEIQHHWATALSSYYVKDKTNIRGFRIVATWGQNECEYAFIIRTN